MQLKCDAKKRWFFHPLTFIYKKKNSMENKNFIMKKQKTLYGKIKRKGNEW